MAYNFMHNPEKYINFQAIKRFLFVIIANAYRSFDSLWSENVMNRVRKRSDIKKKDYFRLQFRMQFSSARGEPLPLNFCSQCFTQLSSSAFDGLKKLFFPQAEKKVKTITIMKIAQTDFNDFILPPKFL
jgi:hypothetical protein